MANLDGMIKQYIEELASPENDTQLHAENNLIEIGLPAVDALITATKNENAQVRWRAAYSLSKIGDYRAFPAILDLVIRPDQPDSETRYEAIFALGNLGDPRAVDPLIEIMKTSNPGEPAIQWASAALAQLGIPAADKLIDVINTAHLDARQYAVDALDTMSQWEPALNKRSIIDALLKHLDDPDIGDDVACALGNIQYPVESYERILVKIFEYCGFTYDPDIPADQWELYEPEIIEYPHDKYEQKILPGRWVKCFAWQLHDIRRKCDEVICYAHQIQRAIILKQPEETKALRELTVDLSTAISEELRPHIFWFLSPSDIVRDTITHEIGIKHLTPKLSIKHYQSCIPIDLLSARLSQSGRHTASKARNTSQQLSRLEINCRRMRAALIDFISEPSAPISELTQGFTNIQAIALEIASQLIKTEYTATHLWVDK